MRASLLVFTALFGSAALAGSASAGEHGGMGGSSLELQGGGFVAVAPKYEGSKDYEVIGFPIIAPAGSGENGIVQFRGPDDLRLRVLNFGGFEAGPLVGWRFDRDDSDASSLRGLGDVDGGVVLGGYAGYRIGNFLPFVSYHHQVSGDDTGGLIRFGAETRMNLAGGITATAVAGATYGDDSFMDAYFSVSPVQSANSLAGLGVYDADAGIKDVYLAFGADVPLSDRWSLKLAARYARLVGDAADSPIVEDENQYFGGLGLTYRFGLPY